MRARPSLARTSARAIICAGVLLASCTVASSPSGSRLASATPSVTATPAAVVTPSATPTFSPTAAPTGLAYQLPPNALPPDAHVTFSVPLDLYQYPDRQSARLGTLDAGTDATVAWGPLLVLGERWYELRAQGWAAIDDLASSGFSLAPVSCPTGTPDMATVGSLSGWERLACYGSRELVLEGYEGVGFGGAFPGTWEPLWLMIYIGEMSVGVTTDGQGVGLMVHVEPGTVDVSRPAVPRGSDVGTARLRLTGHFNDEASSTCRIADYPYTANDAGPTADFDPIGTELQCREHFVLTGFEVLGQ